MSWYNIKLDDENMTPEHSKSVFSNFARGYEIEEKSNETLLVKLFTSKNSIKLFLLVFTVLFIILVVLILKLRQTS